MDFNKLFDIFSEAQRGIEKAVKKLPKKKELEADVYLNNDPEVDDKDRGWGADLDTEMAKCFANPDCDRDPRDYRG